MDIVIIGANHAGIAAANTLMSLCPDEHVVMLDRNSNLSYLGCGTALWLGRQIDSYEGLFYTDAENLGGSGIDIRLETTVNSVDFDAKTVHCMTSVGERFSVNYDKLILATGSLVRLPDVPGLSLSNIGYLKLFQESLRAEAIVANDNIERIAIVGGGYIGIEIVEAVLRRGKKVLLFEAGETILAGYYDNDFSQLLIDRLIEAGAEIHLGTQVLAFEGEGSVEYLVTENDRFPIDAVFCSTGFVPNTRLGMADIELGAAAAYRVDEYQQTSIPDVYAAGDCATIYSNALQQRTYIGLASSAVRSGVVAAYNAAGQPLAAQGTQGSNAIAVLGLNMMATGLTEAGAQESGFDVEVRDFPELRVPTCSGEDALVKLRVVGDKTTGRVLGAQLASEYDVSMAIHAFSLAIEQGMYLDDIALPDLLIGVEIHRLEASDDPTQINEIKNILVTYFDEPFCDALAESLEGRNLDLSGGKVTAAEPVGRHARPRKRAVLSVDGFNLGATGQSVTMAEAAGVDVLSSDYKDLQLPAFMNKNDEVLIRIVYERESRCIVGAQLASTYDISFLLPLFELAIDHHITVDGLVLLDLFFLPHFNQPYNYILLAAKGAE